MRKKYACPGGESSGNNPRMKTAAKPETAIDKGMARPGLPAYIVMSKFADYLPLYRMEDIFQRQGFEISRATQSVWCGDAGQPDQYLSLPRCGPATVSHAVAAQLAHNANERTLGLAPRSVEAASARKAAQPAKPHLTDFVEPVVRVALTTRHHSGCAKKSNSNSLPPL